MKLLYKNKKSLSLDLALEKYMEYLSSIARDGEYGSDEASVNLSFDEDAVREILRLRDKKVSEKLKYVFVVGIGGSNLGTKAVYDALGGCFDGISSGLPKMIFVDTSSGEFLTRIKTFIEREIDSLDEILVCSISKSGGTTETLVNTEAVMKYLVDKFNSTAHERLVVITDFESKFWLSAKEKNIDTLAIPEKVGGRYSVLSAVGLFPLACAGVDIERLLAGARVMREKCIVADVEENPALLSASIMFENFKMGKTINDNFIFNSELESLGKWYRQLMGESVGKEKDLNGKIVNTGITPTVSVGSTDLHSVGQLYLGGPKDKFTTFIYSESVDSVSVPKNRLFPNVVKMIDEKNTNEIMSAILSGTKSAYTKKNLPCMEVVLDDISEYSIGEFLQFKMIEMMFLGKLMNVNPFDQPNVETYKVETKRILVD